LQEKTRYEELWGEVGRANSVHDHREEMVSLGFHITLLYLSKLPTSIALFYYYESAFLNRTPVATKHSPLIKLPSSKPYSTLTKIAFLQPF
jgi:hypothetical protein